MALILEQNFQILKEKLLVIESFLSEHETNEMDDKEVGTALKGRPDAEKQLSREPLKLRCSSFKDIFCEQGVPSKVASGS